MRRVYSADNLLLAGHVQALLETAGISCTMRNMGLVGAIGQLPPTECWPEIWVTRDEDFDRAVTLVTELMQAPERTTGSWRCVCGEKLEAQFSDCWHCGRSRSG